MVRISVSETYDLSTKVNKMSLIGIHTPNMEIIKRSYGGLLSQAKLYRFHHCDVRLACASVLPADPLQVGVDAGDIAPQDMFNPIMYKACSNMGMNQLELRMHGIAQDSVGHGDDFFGQSIDKTDNVVGNVDNFSVYYTLLSNRKGWKVAHPQRGLTMRNLRPYVYERLYNEADSPNSADSPTRVLSVGNDDDITVSTDNNVANGGLRMIRGRPRVMPFLPVSTHLTANVDVDNSGAYDAVVLGQAPDAKDMNIYCGLILMPPAKLNRFYYRLVVRWYIDLVGIRPYSEVQNFGSIQSHVSNFYGSDYTIAENSKDALGMVDVKDAEIEKIMEGA